MTKKTAPFASENLMCDSSQHINDIVEQTTSWLTVNPMLGCSLDCAYCFRSKWNAPSKPQLKTPVEQCLNHLEKNRLFIPDLTPLSANVSSTDALLPKVKETTFDIIKYLDERGYKNIFGLISKLQLCYQDIQFLTSLKNIRFVFLVSYSEIPSHIESVPVEPRIENLINLKKAGIPSVLYYRPIVKGWNDKESKIRKVLYVGGKYASAIAIGGLRLSKEIRSALIDRNVFLPKYKDVFAPKELTDTIVSKVLKIYNELRLTVPLFKHTSCAVSYIFNVRNYNELVRDSTLNCIETCPIEQQKRCTASLA